MPCQTRIIASDLRITSQSAVYGVFRVFFYSIALTKIVYSVPFIPNVIQDTGWLHAANEPSV